MKTKLFSSFSIVLMGLILFGHGWTPGVSPLLAQNVTVTEAIPNTAAQGTVNLNVVIKGSGFKKGAQAQWFVTGTTNPGGVTVNSTAFVKPTELAANITVAADAQTQLKFDVVVTLSSGRTGKGIELFSVTLSDPAIAYTEAKDNQGDLVVMNADGTSKRTVLSQYGAINEFPNWSPDGRFLVFQSNIQGLGLYVVEVSTGRYCKLISTSGQTHNTHPAWSPVPLGDGKYKVAYRDVVAYPDGTTDILLVDVDENCTPSTPVNLTRTAAYNENQPTWSPDGTSLAATGENPMGGPVSECLVDLLVFEDIHVASDGSASYSRLWNLTDDGTPLAGFCAYESRWGKQSAKLAVRDGSQDIWVVDVSNLGAPVATNITRSISALEGEPSWSPDDLQIVFRASSSSKSSIYKMNADGSGVTLLAKPGKRVNTLFHPDWRRNP